MFRIALRSAIAKKMRLISTALSVLLGVAFLTGTLVFTDTMNRTFDDLFANVYESTDSVVRSVATVDTEMGEQRGRVSADAVDAVSAAPGVEVAAGVVQGYAQILDSDGELIGDPGTGAPTFGMSDVPAALNPWTLTEGSRAPGPGEVVVDQRSADVGDLVVGEPVRILTQTGIHEFALVGTVRFGSADSPGGASVSIWDLATAQQALLGGVNDVDIVMIHAREGVSEEELTRNIAAVLPAGLEAITGQTMIEETQDAIHEGLGIFTTFLLVFAVIGVVVACFTIYNTFQIVVSQRLREMSLLRSVGATQRQVLGTQLLEALMIGVVASLGGLVAGLGMAGALKAMLDAAGFDIPATTLTFTARTAIVGIVVGLVVTLVSALVPSLRASRTPPLGTSHELGIETARQVRRRVVLGSVLTGGGIIGFAMGLVQGTLQLVALGAFAVFVGVFVLGPAIARPAATVIGAPLAQAAGVTGAIARQNAARNPKRTARTGGALMIGVALVVGVTVITASVKDWVRDIFGSNFTGDFVVSTSSQGFGGLGPDLAIALNELPEVRAAAGVRMAAARDAEGDTLVLKSVDPAMAAQVFDIGIDADRIAALDDRGILLDDDEAEARGVVVGSSIDLTFLDNVTRTVTVRGIYTEEEMAGPAVISHALNEETGTDQFDIMVFVSTADGVSSAAARAAIEREAAAYPNGTLEDRGEFVDSQAARMDPIVNMMYGLLGLAIVIALLSIANSMALSIHERAHELGLLRAVGMTRGQMRRSVGFESFVVATIGTLLGVVIGIFFGWSISVVIRDAGLGEFAMPLATIAVVALVAVVGGLLAAAKPAWHASRLDVLRAIATQ